MAPKEVSDTKRNWPTERLSQNQLQLPQVVTELLLYSYCWKLVAEVAE
jgi:hypothetical protein